MTGTLDKYDDDMWEYVIRDRMQQYIPYARKWWADVEDLIVKHTGVFKVQDAPNGLMYRVTNTPVRSPIKGVQAFPFVPVAILNIYNVPGGICRMVSRICEDGKVKMDEFTLVEKSALPSTYHQGQFLAIIPTDLLNGLDDMGRFVYLTMPEMFALDQGKVLPSVKLKVKVDQILQ